MPKRTAAQTAFGPMVVVAVEQFFPPEQRLIRDDLVLRFLPPAVGAAVSLCRWRWIRNRFVDSLNRRHAGVWGSMACRKRYIDEKVEEAVRAGVRAGVILGAGLDTRAYRLLAPAGIPAYEVDLPANSSYKQKRLRSLYGRVPERVTLLPIDLQTGDLDAALRGSGFRMEAPAIFVWEAVTQYLTEDGVRRTFDFLSRAAAGSRLVFTYVRKDFLEGANFYGAEQIYRDFVTSGVWRFGIAPDAVDRLLREYGWTERERAGSAELTSRYIQPTGRDVSVMEIERLVYAAKL